MMADKGRLRGDWVRLHSLSFHSVFEACLIPFALLDPTIEALVRRLLRENCYGRKEKGKEAAALLRR